MNDASAGVRKGFRPSSVALLFYVWALAIPVVFGERLLNTDGDLPRHLVLGRHILQHGVVFPDVFSNTRPGAPFIAYEWLSEVVFSLVERAGGLAAVVVLATLLIATSIALVMRVLRGRVEPLVAIPVGFTAAILTGPHWIARPHLFSFLCLAILLVLVTRPPDVTRNIGLLVLFALWANLHPGFLYGLAIGAAYLVGDVLDHPGIRRLRADALSAAMAVGGTLLNPLGWGLHHEILRHLADREAMGVVDEFQRPDLTSGYGILFIALVLVVLILLAARRARPRYAVAIPFVAAVVAGLMAQRNIPLFGLFAFPLAMELAAEPIRRWRPGWLEKPRRNMEAEEAVARTAPWVVAAVVVLGILGLSSGRIGSLRIMADAFSPEVFPVTAVERLRDAGMEDHTLFNAYTWGGYILWAWPGERIYIDGMANFFGGALVSEYASVLRAEDGWQQTLRKRGVDLLLLPRGVPLAAAAGSSGEWTQWYADETAVVFLLRGVNRAAAESALSPPGTRTDVSAGGRRGEAGTEGRTAG